MKTKLYKEIAQCFCAYKNSLASNNGYAERWKDAIDKMVYENLVCGGGFCNIHFDYEESRVDKLVIWFSYHHMNDAGFYVGWTDHKLIITPSLVNDIDMRITGRDKDDIKNYFYEVFDIALREQVDYTVLL